MVEMSGEYFGVFFKVQSGVIQGYPISSTILNVLVDAVLRNWVSLVAATEGVTDPGTEGFGLDIQWLEDFLMLAMDSLN